MSPGGKVRVQASCVYGPVVEFQLMYYTYVLENSNGDFYVGYTANLKKRLSEHNNGKTFSTKNRHWRVVYYEACMSQEDARRRETYLKTSQGRRMFRLRIKEYLYQRRKLKSH